MHGQKMNSCSDCQLGLSAPRRSAALTGIKLDLPVQKIAENRQKLRGINVCTCSMGAKIA
jgi:hypothetical protein